MPRKVKLKPAEEPCKPVVERMKPDFMNVEQENAWNLIDKNVVTFLLGPAGVGKSHIAAAYAVNEILNKNKKKIVLTRPIVEAGEKLGHLPGTFEEKVLPYMAPLFDCIDRIFGNNQSQKDRIMRAIEIAPLAYLRGRTLHDSICILDEAQNTTFLQMKMFLTRFGENSKVIVTGDPMQSDLKQDDQAFSRVINKLDNLDGVGIAKFTISSIVRHPLIADIITRLEL